VKISRAPLDLANLFNYHPPVGNQPDRYSRLRQAAKVFAAEIVFLTPAGPDQSAAIRKVREAVMTANAAIACSCRFTPDNDAGTHCVHCNKTMREHSQ
jgi:hypothetical protein